MITVVFEEREAPEYDEDAVKENQRKKQHNRSEQMKQPLGGSCSGTRAMQFERNKDTGENKTAVLSEKQRSRPLQWPVQMKLVPVKAPFFDKAKLLIAADCTAYSYANMHEEFMRGKVTIIGCPKLDDVDYSKKLTQILMENDITSVTIVRMEVPCCGGLAYAAEQALKASGKFLPWQVVTISCDGKILD